MRPSDISAAGCSCLRSGPARDACASTYLGIDPAGGRFAEVEIEECTLCRRQWLHYEVDDAARPGEGRWYRGLIPAGEADRLTAESAASFLGRLDWYLAGGPRFGPGVRRLKGRPEIEPDQGGRS